MAHNWTHNECVYTLCGPAGPSSEVYEDTGAQAASSVTKQVRCAGAIADFTRHSELTGVLTVSSLPMWAPHIAHTVLLSAQLQTLSLCTSVTQANKCYATYHKINVS